MNAQRTITTESILAAGIGVLLAVEVWACSVPVFRYALEQWPADPYPVVVFHRGPLSPSDESVVTQLENAVADPAARTNIDVHVVDLDDAPDAEMRALWREQGESPLPRMVVRYPGRALPAVWSGPLNASAVGALTDSPARREVAKRLAVHGQSAVWVFVPGGDAAKDKAAETALRDELARLEETLELPEPVDGESADTLDVTDRSVLRLAFSVLRISRDEPAERIFLAMLLRSEADLETLEAPMAFPIFGRGRVLHALVGAGINREMITESCTFLVGPCSCQVKELNPGVDLVMTIDWEGTVAERVVDEATSAVMPGFADPPVPVEDDAAPSTVASSTSANVETAGLEGSTGTLHRNLLLVVLAGCGALAAATILLKVKKA